MLTPLAARAGLREVAFRTRMEEQAAQAPEAALSCRCRAVQVGRCQRGWAQLLQLLCRRWRRSWKRGGAQAQRLGAGFLLRGSGGPGPRPMALKQSGRKHGTLQWPDCPAGSPCSAAFLPRGTCFPTSSPASAGAYSGLRGHQQLSGGRPRKPAQLFATVCSPRRLHSPRRPLGALLQLS